MIERVEVMRGGGSALFGSSAIAGTINIITKAVSYTHLDVYKRQLHGYCSAPRCTEALPELFALVPKGTKAEDVYKRQLMKRSVSYYCPKKKYLLYLSGYVSIVLNSVHQTRIYISCIFVFYYSSIFLLICRIQNELG